LAPELLWTLERRDVSLRLPGIESFLPNDHSHSQITISTELHQFLDLASSI